MAHNSRRRLYSESFGLVRLKETAPNEWRIQYRHPGDGHYVRQKLAVLSRDEAIQVAVEQGEALAAGRGLLPKMRQSRVALAEASGPTIKEAMLDCINASRASARTKQDYRAAANSFLRWIAERHPRIQHWRELRPLHAEQFVQHLVADGKSGTSIRLYLYQVKATSRFMARNFIEEGFRDIGLAVKPPILRNRKEPEVLDAKALGTLLDYLEQHDPTIYPIALLQSLGGLRLREAIAVREEDVSLREGTVVVAETPLHRPKTLGSFRTIPVPRRVLAALMAHIEGLAVRRMDGVLFVSSEGQPWIDNGYSNRLRKAMRACHRAGGPERLGAFAPRRLRATFATLARSLGADEHLLRRFLGHVPRDVLGRHYVRIELNELRSIPALLEGDWAAGSDEKEAAVALGLH